MEAAITSLEYQLKYAIQRLEDAKEDVVKAIDRLADSNARVEETERTVCEYQKAINVLKEAS